ncbi:MAG: hypothetical protein Q8N55_02190 [bacterium]|nr:hypothetical protein [bacterium]
MVKKIIDIIEPVAVSFKERKSSFFDKFRVNKSKKKRSSKKVQTKKKMPEKIKKVKKSSQKTNLNLIIAVSVVILVLFISFVVLSSRSKAEITLTPKLIDLEMAGDFSILTSQEELDLKERKAPAKFFETEEEKWGVFQSTGSDTTGTKATGFITVYNTQNPPRSFSFVAGTRFVSSDGAKTFRATEKIILPAGRLEAGKLVPGKVKTKVEAQEPGESYNGAPSKFAVPGLSGTAFYYNIYAESEEGITGGSSSIEKVVSKEDLEKAEESLRNELEEKAEESLKRFIEDGYILPDKGIIFSDFSVECFQKEGDKAVEFNCYGKLKAKGLACLYEDVLSFLEVEKDASVGEQRKILEESLSLSLFSKEAPSLGGVALVGFLGKAKAFGPVDEKEFISVVLGKSKSEIQEVVRNDYSQLSQVEIKLWPFWQRKVSNDISKIKVIFKINN